MKFNPSFSNIKEKKISNEKILDKPNLKENCKFQPDLKINSTKSNFKPDLNFKPLKSDFKPDFNFKPIKNDFKPGVNFKPIKRDFTPDLNFKPLKKNKSQVSQDLIPNKIIKDHMKISKYNNLKELKNKIFNQNIQLKEKREKYSIIDKVFNENSIYAKSTAKQEEMAKLLLKQFNPEQFKRNPNLKYNYFEKIDTKEKAYWLGFIYADGNISKNLDRFKINLSKKDENHLKKLCGTLNLDFQNIRLEISKETNKKYSVLNVYNKKIIRDLLNHKVVPSKTKILEFPDINDKKLQKGFLLGFFDGDGIQGTSRIKSASKKFLEQIKEKFSIKYEIKTIEKQSEIKNKDGNARIIKGKCYALFLGSKLFNELLENYTISLERKRIRFKTNEERIEKIKMNAWRGHHDVKLKASKEEIEDLVFKIPKTYIAPIYGVSAKTISNWCKRWNIRAPSRGDWAKMYSTGIQPKTKQDWIGLINFGDDD